MIGDKKDALFRDNPNPAILDRKFFSEKAYYVPGFEPSSLGQNAVAAPLAPPPLPIERENFK